MAAGWLRRLAGNHVVVHSGGSEPGNEVNAMAVEAMAEVGIDISTESPKRWTDELIQNATSSSRWVAATPVPSFLVSATLTGRSMTRRG